MTEQGQEGTARSSDAGPSPTTAEPGAADADADGDDQIAPLARVVLVGLPGSGKSTIGRKLARELGVRLYDTDAGIEADTGRTIPDIFATDGEAEFRRIEEEVVRRAVLGHDGVVSLGGGSVLSARTRDILRDAVVVYLEISVSEGVRRTGASSTRPLLNGVDPGAKYRDLMRERRPLYREIATVRVRTDGRSPGRVVRMILAKLGLESVRTDLEAARPNTGNATPASGSGSVTSRPGTGTNRSKNRRRARARAAARRGGTEQSGVASTERRTAGNDRKSSAAAQSDTSDATATQGGTGAARTTGSAQGESRTTGSRRSRRTRSRRGGARIRSTRDADSSAGTRAANTEGRTGDRGASAGGRASSRGADAESRVGNRGAGPQGRTSQRGANAGTRATGRERTGASDTAASDRAAGSRGGARESGQRGGQPSDAGQATTNERRRRGQPRRRSGRRNNNGQKESEQRT